MDEDLMPVVLGVRADTAGFAREVAAMRDTLEGSLGAGADRAGRAIETALLRAVRTGKLGFDDLKGVATAALDAIAKAALREGVAAVVGGGASGGLASVLAGLAGKAGRATGGPVAPGQAWVVGERGPELFVPTASGRIEAFGNGGMGAAREVRVAITIDARDGEAPAALAQSARQVARAVRAALAGD